MNVVKVNPIQHLRLEVQFSDGLRGEVRFHENHLYGVFEPLKNPEYFFKVNCDAGFVAWPGDIDLAPDAMYEEIKKNGSWELN